MRTRIICTIITIALSIVSSLHEPAIASEPMPQLSTLDGRISDFMKKYQLPGAQVTVAKGGKIIYSKPFGFADEAGKVPVANDNLFRIASVSKAITAVAIMQLVQQGKLKLSDKAFAILDNLQPEKGFAPDPRLKDVTVEHLLHHTGGFSIKDGDPQQYLVRYAASAFNDSVPPPPASLIRCRIARPLDFEPGSKAEYSNFGFNVLGRIIEKVSGQMYGDYVKRNVLAPAGITSMELARTRFQDRYPREVWYEGGDADSWSVLPYEQSTVSNAYGGDYAIEVMDAHGGWIASADDLARFVQAVDGHPVAGGKPLLQGATRTMMLEPSRFQEANGSVRARGVLVRPKDGAWLHAGALRGCSAVLYSLPGDIAVTAVFNNLPPFNMLGQYFTEMQSLLADPFVSSK